MAGSGLRTRIRDALWLAAIGLLVATGASFLGERWWAFDLAAHFRPHMAAIALAAALLAAVARAPLVAAVLALVLVGNAAPLAARYAAAGATPCDAAGTLRLLTLNLYDSGTDPAAFRRLIEREEPDLVLLTELPPDLGPLIDDLPALPPYRVIDRIGSPFDVALFSRWPVAAWQMDRSVHRRLPVLSADLCSPAGDDAAPLCLRVVGLHAAQPLLQQGVPQNAQLELAAEYVRSAPGGRAVLMGDLNLTPWSPRFDRLLAEAGLHDVSARRPFAATWRSALPGLGLVIDHVLASDGLAVACRRVAEDVGSDHLPVVADLAFEGDAVAGLTTPSP